MKGSKFCTTHAGRRSVRFLEGTYYLFKVRYLQLSAFATSISICLYACPCSSAELHKRFMYIMGISRSHMPKPEESTFIKQYNSHSHAPESFPPTR